MISEVASQLTDAELVARCRAGDESAWSELVERFSRYVYAIAIQGFRLSEQDAEDVFQEVFARTYERLDALRDDNAVRPWLAQLTRNLSIDKLRDKARVEPTEDIDGGADESLAELDLALTVREALLAVGEPCSDLLDRFFTRDESYRTISEKLEIPPGTIASRISRCLVKLRGQIEGRNDGAAPSGVR
jgi:RNA polymerase sigma factor (sigma-70 family)